MKKIIPLLFLMVRTPCITSMSRSIDLFESSRIASTTQQSSEELFREGLRSEREALHNKEREKLEEAKDFYKRAADMGNAKAQNNLGVIYRRENDYKNARYYYELAANQDLPVAQFNLAMLLLKEDDKSKAAYELMKKAADAENGDSDAQYHMGLLREKENNDVDAKAYFLRAAGQKHPEAQYRLGLLYEKEHLTEEAKATYEQASGQQHPEAPCRLGLLLEKEDKVKEAVGWYKRAVENGNTEVLLVLALHYRKKGKHLKARDYFERAAQKGNAQAQYYLAYFDKEKGLDKKNEHCLTVHLLKIVKQQFKHAAAQGDQEARYHLALMYHQQGRIERAKLLLKSLHKEGSKEAAYLLGVIALDENKAEKAKMLFKQAAPFQTAALHNLGLLYYQEGNIERARKYSIEAAQRGFLPAQRFIENLFETKNNSPAAQQFYQLSLNNGDAPALFHRGMQHMEEAYTEEAKRIYKYYLDCGFELGQCHLGKNVEECNKEAKLLFEWAMETPASNVFDRPCPPGMYFGMVHMVLGNNSKKADQLSLRTKQDPGAAEAILGINVSSNRVRNEKTEEACRYLTLAADQGHPPAQHQLGVLYLRENDAEKARSLFTLAANQGYAPAQYFLGRMHEREHELDEAKKYYLLAAHQDYAKAYFRLAEISADEYEADEADHYFKLAADHGDLRAQFVMGKKCSDKGEREQAQHYFALAAAHGETAARYCMYVYMLNPPSKDFLKHAAEQGNARAQYDLGCILERENNLKEALQYYTMAAEKGDSAAQFQLGMMYEFVERNIESALDYYRKAAAQGHAEAQRCIDEVLANRDTDDNDC
jgi:hypothetical protein